MIKIKVTTSSKDPDLANRITEAIKAELNTQQNTRESEIKSKIVTRIRLNE